ncbi:MAG TPA: tetrahydrofolate dehydrogenase/cyclohydrolase catalytic domain-containing protein, partial [Gemmatimonadaceae bacterium]|nr:tetrahydrofolate dehydrogenase/cyclohydrolase catalytic domain-containing protein [Gemmatimonadaceae bacterium]
MPAKIIDGAAIADKVRADVAVAAAALAKKGIIPGLTVVLVGEDPASAVYVGAKEKACKEAGMRGETIRMPATTTQAELLAVVDRLNADPAIHGILVQSPLPKQIDPQTVIRRIASHKDVDGFHPVNVGKVLIGDKDAFAPCTPWGVQVLLEEFGV